MMLIIALLIGRSFGGQSCGQINFLSYPRGKSFDATQNQCVGVWTKYIPYYGYSIMDTQYEWTIFTLQSQISFSISFKGNEFIHTWLINGQSDSDGIYQFHYQSSGDYGVYEGLPFLHLSCLDREKNSVIFYDYPYNQESYIQTQTIEFGFDEEPLWYFQFIDYFYGQKSQVQQTGFMPLLEDFKQFVQTCDITLCKKSEFKNNELITITYNQQNITFYQFYSTDAQRTFQLGAWVKFIPRENLKSATQQFLNFTNRATSMNPNNQYKWDVFLYEIARLNIVYDSVNQDQNGFIVYTYSYNSPIPGDVVNIVQLKHLSSEYYNQMTSWIFIVFQKQDIDAQLYIYFTKSNTEIVVPFPTKIYHFTPSFLYLRISGEKRKINEDFTGQLYYIHLKQCQLDQKPVCHNTCQTCSGPLQTHCLTCGDSQITKRLLNPSSMSCDCAFGYISVDYSLDCKRIYHFNLIQVPNQVLTQGLLSEIPVSDSYCKLGQWKGNYNQCFDCPLKYNQLQNILCGDCYESPNTIQNRLLCTFDYIKDPSTGVYTKKVRRIQEYQLYNKDLDSGEIRLYEGVIKICDDGDMRICYLSRYLSMDNQSLMYVACGPSNTLYKIDYYFHNSLCYPCSQFCLTCDDSDCIQCEEGYSLYDGQCQKCQTNCQNCQFSSGEYQCTQCIQKYTNLIDKCYQCSSNTEICAYFQIDYKNKQLALKCTDVEQYYLTFTQDCFLNDIEFCLIQYQYSEEINQSTFDIFFKQLPKTKAQTFCAQCQPQYVNKLTSCEFNPQLQINDNVVQYQGQTYNIIKMYDKDQLLNNYCEVQFCKFCINDYEQPGIQFCIECQFGYYPDSISGICKVCPPSCYNCVMQHKIYKDAWKWQIRAFYHYLITSQNIKTFNINGVDDVNLYEVICTQCFTGKELYEGACIDPCDPSCKRCDKIDGVNVCKECYDSILGKQLSISDNKCYECQDNCQFCQPKTDLNFSPTISELNYLFRQCLIPYEIENLFYNNYNFKQCQNYVRCEKVMNITLNVYCDYDQFQTDRTQAEDLVTFDFFNFYYTQIISYRNLTDFGEVYIYIQYKIEKLYMLKFYNQIQIDHIYYHLNLMGNKSGLCYLTDYNLMISSKVRNNVFGLKSMNLIISQTAQELVIENHLMILGFTSVQFKDINLRFLRSKIDFLDAQQVSIVNSYFQESWMETYYVEFEAPLAKIVNLKDILISNFYRDLSIIALIEIFKIYDSVVHVENITLKEVNFVNITLFKLYGSLLTELYIKNLQSDSNFYNASNLIKVSSQIANLVIELEDIQFQGEFDNSCIIRFESLNNFKIKNLTLKNLKVVNESILIESSSVQISGLQLQNVLLQNSKLYQSLFLNQNNYEFIDFSFVDVVYDSYSQFAFIQQQEGRVNMDNLFMNNVTNAFTYQRGLTTLFDIQIQNIQLTNLYIKRSKGYTEFKLINSKFIVISNITVILDPLFTLQSLQQNFECFQQEYQGQYFSTIFNIRNFSNLTLDEALFVGAQSVDQPLILIQQISRFLESQTTFINISNSLFQKNQILISDLTVLTSIILIQSDQPGNIFLDNITVQESIFIDYIQDTVYDPGLFLITETTYQYISLKNSFFDKNMVFNSTQSLMRLSGYQVNIQNCKFTNQNKYNYDLIRKYIYFSFSDIIYHETIQRMFPLLSQGGSAFIRARVINITDCLFQGNRGIKGGSLYLKTQGSIAIENCSFIDSVVQSDQMPTLGGAIYITGDSSSLQIQIKHTLFQLCTSGQGGGSINIGLLDSNTDNLTLMADNITIRDVISLQGSFLQLQSKQDKQNYLFFSNIQIINSYEALQQYFGQLRNSSSDNMVTFLADNHLFLLDYSYIDIKYLSIQQQHLIGFLKSTNTYYLQFYQILITNFYIINQQIIDIKLNSQTGGEVFIKNLQIIKIDEFSQITNCSNQLETLKVYSIKYTKCMQFEAPQKLDYFYDNEKNTQLIECIIFILQNITNSNSLFHIYSSQIAQIKQIINVKLQDIVVQNYSQGLFLIDNVQTSQIKNNIVIKRIIFQNNICGNAGCLNLKGIEASSRILQLESIQSIVLLPQTVIITDSLFMNNKAYQGGAINIQNLDVLINSSIIQNNTASYQGGGIYFIGEKKLNLYFTIISKNTAFQGGALFLDNKYLSQPFQTELQMDSNKAYQFGQNTAEKPSSLTLQLRNLYFFQKILLKKSEHIFYESIFVPSYRPPGFQKNTTFIYFPSGQILQSYQYFDEKQQQFLNYNLSLRIIALNLQLMKQANLEETYCQIAGRHSDQTNFSESYFSNSKFYFNTITKDYNLDDLIIYFDPYQQGYLEIQISCNSIETPIFNQDPPYQAISFIKDYRLYFNAKTFKCQRGEFYNQTQGTCVLCDYTQQFYTVVAGGKCQIKNDFTTKQISPARIELRQGYWRPSEINDNVESCYHLETNCLGGWNPGDSSCIPGHIGALCESCDLLNTRGQGKFSQSKQYKCGDCASPNENALIIFFVSVWTLISILVSVKGTVETIKWTAQSIKLKRIGLRVEIYRENNSSILIKLFISYLLILASITTFQINLPAVFGEIIINIGNPVQSMSYSLDCILVDMSDISFIYFRVIWAIIMPIIYSTAFLITFIIFIIIGKANYSFSIVSTSLIYIYAYMQPNLIGGFISLISYRNISGILWIQANVAFQYMTHQHYNWIYGFLIPSLTLFGLIIPLLFFRQLYKNKLNLNNPRFRMIWGYMYNEYLDIAYFWEIIKIGQREVIIIFLTFYQDQVVLKSALVFLVIIFYDILAKYYQPYKTKRMNHLDSQSSLVCASSIVSAQVIYTASQSNDIEITWPFYIYLTIVNSYFTLKMILLIIQSYLSLFTVVLEKLKRLINDRYPQFQYVNPQVKSFLEPTALKKKRINYYIGKIRKSLMPQVKEISKFRRNQTLAMSLQLNDAHNSHQISSPKSIDNVLLFTKHDQLQQQILSEQDIIIESSVRGKEGI